MKKLLQAQIDIASHKFTKDAVNPFHKSKYMTLDAVMQGVLPILHSHGLILVQSVDFKEGVSVLETAIFDAEKPEQKIMSTYKLTPKKEDDPQAVGSAITYARRYSLCALLGICADDDDDGNKASRIPHVAPSRATEVPSRFPDARYEEFKNSLISAAKAGDREKCKTLTRDAINNGVVSKNNQLIKDARTLLTGGDDAAA